jgi:hypothetical protein
MELAMSNMLTPSQQDEWDQKVNASLQVKKNADDAEANASAVRKAERKRLKQEAKAEAEAKAKADAEAAEAEAASLASAARKAERKRLKQKAKADAEAAEAEAKSKAEAVTVTEAAEAEAAALASAALKAERKRLKQKAKADAEAADAEAKAKAEAVTVTAASTEAAALAQREAYANEDALQPAPLNEAERLVDLDNAIEAEAVVDLQEETVANKKIMMHRIKSQHESYGTAFEKVMLKDYQSELKKMVQTTERQQMENFVPFDKGDSNALYDIVNNVCVCELKMFDSDDYRINVKTQSDIINRLHEERDEKKKQYQKARADGDVEIMKTFKEDYDDKTKEINNPKNYFKIQVTKYIGIDNYYNKITPTYIQDKTTGKLLLRDVKKNGTSILPVRNVGLKIVVWTSSGLYYYNIFDDPDSFEFIPTSKSRDGHSIGYIRPKFKKDTSSYKGSDKNVKNYLIPINKLKFYKL